MRTAKTHLERIEAHDSLDREPATHTRSLQTIVCLHCSNADHSARLSLSVELPDVNIARVLRANELGVLKLLRYTSQGLNGLLVSSAIMMNEGAQESYQDVRTPRPLH